MARKPQNNVALGVLTLVVIALAFAAIILLGGPQLENTQAIRVLLRHDVSSAQLNPGAPVVCGPATVGKVMSVKPVERKDAGAPDGGPNLFYEIAADIEKSVDLRVDGVVAVEGQLLGGGGRLIIRKRGVAAQRATGRTPIVAVASGLSARLSEISGEFDGDNPDSLLSRIKRQLNDSEPTSAVYKIHAILDNLTTLSRNLRTTFDPERDQGILSKIDSVLTRLDDITKKLAQQVSDTNDATAMSKLHAALDELNHSLALVSDLIEENRSAVKSTFESTASAARHLDQDVIPDLQAELDRDDPRSFLAKLHGAMDDLDAALKDINVVAQKARHVAELGAPSITETINNAKTASEHLKAAGREIRRSPWRLIHKPSDEETREALLLDAVREFSESLETVSATLDQAEILSHYDASDPEQAELLEKLREALQESVGGFQQAEEQLWKQLEKMK